MGCAVVAAGHALVTDAASELLRAGGNAFDAALAAGFAASMAEPMFTSLGGGGFLLARNAEGREVLFDFFADTPGRGLPAGELEPHFLPMTVRFPGSEQVFNIGLGSVAVPGNVAGFLHVHERLATRPLSEVVAPAVRLAREGVELTDHQAYVIGLLHPINTSSAAGRAIYTPKGRDPRPGERIANPDLALFLEALADGADLYRGELASAIARDMREGRGLLTEADLAAYQVIEREPLATSYRGMRLLTNPAPSFGGGLVALSLALLEREGPCAGPMDSAQPLRRLASVMLEVERLREHGVLTPAALQSSGGTTHVSVCDAEGNAASMTLSNGEGSGYVVPGTGIMLNNMLGEDDLHPDGFHAAAPGERVASMMSPSMLLRDDRVELILGSGGSKRIRTALLQVIHRFVDGGADVREAVESPRMHWDGETLQLEPGFPAGSVRALEEVAPVNLWDERNLYFGGVHAVDPDGEGAGDPRRGGHAVVVRA